MIKKITIALLFISNLTFSQVIINADPATEKKTPSSSSVLLEFGNDNNKGIILPYVETIPAEGSSNARGGTFIFDVSSSTEFKIKVKNENSGWTDLSIQSGYSSNIETVVKNPQPEKLKDNSSAKAIIGAETSESDGILVLESTEKAMVLPIVDDYRNIKNPSPGMVAFLKGSTATKHRLIVFNGQKWAFWKP